MFLCSLSLFSALVTIKRVTDKYVINCADHLSNCFCAPVTDWNLLSELLNNATVILILILSTLSFSHLFLLGLTNIWFTTITLDRLSICQMYTHIYNFLIFPSSAIFDTFLSHSKNLRIDSSKHPSPSREPPDRWYLITSHLSLTPSAFCRVSPVFCPTFGARAVAKKIVGERATRPSSAGSWPPRCPAAFLEWGALISAASGGVGPWIRVRLKRGGDQLFGR